MRGPALASTMMDGALMLDAFVERAALLFPNVEVVSRRADKSLERHGYREIGHRVRSLATGLARAGLREGDRVATLMWNHHFHLEAYFGVPMAGGVYHTLNLRLGVEDIAYIVRHARDRFLLVDDVLLPLLAKVPGILAKDGGPIERVFVADVAGIKEIGGFESLDELIGGGDAVVLVEWADRFEQRLGADHLRIELSHAGDARRLVATATGPRSQKLLDAWAALC